MTSVILTSELSWQRNDVITFITFIRIPRHQEIFSKIAQGSMYHLYLPQYWQSLNKFCKSVIEIFWDEVFGAINTAKTYYGDNCVISKEHDALWECSFITGIVFNFHFHVHWRDDRID